jgi:excisionase family DNA binding protein
MTAAQLAELRADVATAIASRATREVFTTEEAAEYLRCSAEQLEALRTKGDGPRYAKLGRLVRYRRGALDEWLVSNERAHTAEGA